MATYYVGYRNVLRRGDLPLNTTHDRYARYPTTGVLAGFPDTQLDPTVYNRLFGNAKISTQWQPLDDAGDRAGVVQPNPLYFYGVPGAKVLAGTTGWDTAPTDAYKYFGLSSATVLDHVGIATAQINYYGNYVGTPPLANASRLSLVEVTNEDDLLVWKGTPSSRAL